jgi:hypothetical protein
MGRNILDPQFIEPTHRKGLATEGSDPEAKGSDPMLKLFCIHLPTHKFYDIIYSERKPSGSDHRKGLVTEGSDPKAKGSDPMLKLFLFIFCILSPMF